MTKSLVSAPSAPVSASAVSAVFPDATPDQVEQIIRNGFSVRSSAFDDAVFYSDCFGGLVSLSALRRDYEEHREEVEADDIHSFGEWVDCLTDMGGDMSPIYGCFYGFTVDGKHEMDINHTGDEFADSDLGYVLDMAEEKSGKIEIVRYVLSADWYTYLPEEE